MTIEILLQDIIDRIHTKNYYIGESFKMKDLDYAIIQSSYDNMDELKSSLESSLYDIMGMMEKRMKSMSFKFIDEKFILTIEPYDRIPNNSDIVVEILKRYISDYCVQDAVYKWLLILKPEIANPIGSALPTMQDKIIKQIGKLSNPIKRRYSLFGI